MQTQLSNAASWVAMAAAAMTFAAASVAHAEDASAGDGADDSPNTIDSVIVVGRSDTPITVAPRGLSVSLGKAEFEAINAVNVEDLMKYAPDFFVRKRFAGDDNAVVALRGTNTVQSARTIVLVDGFVVSNFLGNRYDYPPKWNVVGPSEVRQFDIVYGPYSARYGGNSMGGIISVTTRAPEANETYATAQVMVMPFKEYGFDETFKGYSLEGGGTFKPTGSPWSLRGGFRHFDNVGQSMTYNLLTAASGAGTPVSGAYVDKRLATPVFGAASPVHVIQDQLRLRVAYDTAGGWRAEGLAFAWKTNQGLTDTRTFLKNAAGAPVYQGKVSFGGHTWNAAGLTKSETDRTEYLAGFKLTGSLSQWRTALNLSRYWIADQDARTSNDYATGAANGAGTQTLARTPGWWTFDATFDRGFGAHNLGFGVNANLYATDQDTYKTTHWRDASAPSFTTATRGKTSLWGVWVEDAWDLADEVILTAGLRYDAWRAYDGGLDKLVGATRFDTRYPVRTDSSISPKLSLQGRLFGDTDVQLSLGTATRFPTVGELFQGRFDDISHQIDPQSFDPNLKPERSTDASLLARRQLGPVRATLSLFYQDIDDAIFSFSGLNQFGTVVTSYKNVDEVRQVGAELILEATDFLVPGLDVDLNLARIDAETVRNRSNPAAEGEKFPRIPDWRSNGNIRYRINDGLKASIGWRYGSRPNSDLLGLVRGDAYGFQSEYLTFDSRLSWDVSSNAQLSLGVDNLFNDQAYVSHPLPQRTFVVDLKTKW